MYFVDDLEYDRPVQVGGSEEERGSLMAFQEVACQAYSEQRVAKAWLRGWAVRFWSSSSSLARKAEAVG